MENHNGHKTSDVIEKAQTYKQEFKEEVMHMMDFLASYRKSARQVCSYLCVS